MDRTATLTLDKTWLAGLMLLVVSLAIFCIPSYTRIAEVPDGLFFANYVIAIVYFVIVVANNRLSIRHGNGLAPLLVLLVISLVSCYALNRTFEVFDDSVPWWSAVLVIVSVNYLSTPFFFHFPSWLQYLSCAIAGIALIVFAYLAAYLAPMYLFGSIGVLALGLGMHTFIPLLFVVYTIVFLFQVSTGNRHAIHAFGIGICIALGTIIQFNIRWSAEVGRVNSEISQDSPQNHLPAWVTVAQHCRRSTFNEHFLKAGLVYEVPGKLNWGMFMSKPVHFHEQLRHDPLIMIACVFAGESNLDDDDRVKILESLYDSRHYALDRLWDGDALATTAVKTNVELYPGQHLSYTEEELTVAALDKQDTWPPPQEGIYTFHLPEGAVVSSLSLWIGDHEAKGVFTSRHKADSAYQQIVGYENHDPSVVHWQEGDKVVVRVFPVDVHSPRRFRIGITAPLESKENRLVYHSIYFDGPPAAHASGIVNIHPLQPLEGLQQSPRPKDTYAADWSLSFEDPGISPQTFTFNGHRYTSQAETPSFDAADFQKIYLDLNAGWTHQEFATLLPVLKDHKVYVWQPGDGLIRLTPGNQEDLFRKAGQLQFSLFPLQAITDKEHSLFITKSNASSPALSDLNHTTFASKLQAWLAAPGKLRLYSIGNELSPYLKTLKACGAFHFETGGWIQLDTCIIQHRFLHDSETPDLVRIDPAGMFIRRSAPDPSETQTPAPPPSTESATAPDHLLRLFAYRQIQQQLYGRLPGDYTWEDPATVDSLVTTAQEAGIVSPVSSLVVLESDDDYKRFNITQSQNSLQDASLHRKGAVPEPGQWALLLATLGFLLFLRLRSTKTKNA